MYCKFFHLSLSLFLCACLSAQSFSEVAPTFGINQEYGVGLFGGGVSFADFNNDGLDDLTFTSSNNQPLFFYRNTGSSFVSVSLVSNTQETKKALWADYDNDGDPDLFVTAFNTSNRLYRNDGGFFTDVTISSFRELDTDPSFGATWCDYDKDGLLDLYIVNYEGRNKLWRGSASGVFIEVASALAVEGQSSDPGFDVCILDFDGNGWSDIYVINDKYGIENVLYYNDNGVFTRANNSGTELSVDAMNAGGGDFDNDGDFDLYVTNTEGGNFLLSNDGGGFFSDETSSSGTAINAVCWGANSIDYDNDTDLDIYVSAEDFSGLLSNPFLVNQGDGTFEWPLMFSGGLGGIDTGNSYGNATGDYNDDGLLDLAVSQSDSPFTVWENQEAGAGNFIKVELIGTVSNRDGIGARVEVDLPDGTRLYRWQLGSEGYLSQNSKKLHFGIGDATSIEELRIVWPSGLVDVYSDISLINQLQLYTEGETTLPVTIIDFTANAVEDAVALNWNTIQEFNFDYFVVERSSDGLTFLDVSRVTGKGEVFEREAYTAKDLPPHAGVWYYRLRMVDLDGSHSFSVVRSINFPKAVGKSIFVSRFPVNPAIDRLSFEMYSSVARQGQLSLLDESGRVVLSSFISLNHGQTTIDFPFSRLPAGHYFLKVSFADWAETMPVVIR